MGMGMGFCCCGDEAPPGLSSSSKPMTLITSCTGTCGSLSAPSVLTVSGYYVDYLPPRPDPCFTGSLPVFACIPITLSCTIASISGCNVFYCSNPKEVSTVSFSGSFCCSPPTGGIISHDDIRVVRATAWLSFSCSSGIWRYGVSGNVFSASCNVYGTACTIANQSNCNGVRSTCVYGSSPVTFFDYNGSVSYTYTNPAPAGCGAPRLMTIEG